MVKSRLVPLKCECCGGRLTLMEELMAWCAFCEMAYLIEGPASVEPTIILPEVEPLTEEHDDEDDFEPEPEPSPAEKLRERMIAEQQQFVSEMVQRGARREGGRWVVASFESTCVPGFVGLVAIVVCSLLAIMLPAQALWCFVAGVGLLVLGVGTAVAKVVNASSTMELIHDYGEHRREQRDLLRRLRSAER